MIRGLVNARKEATVSLQVRDAVGRLHDRQAVIDTGFSGYVSLPPSLIQELQLSYQETLTYTLGNDRDELFDLYRATIVWDGEDRPVLVLAREGVPLIGMSMLQGYHLFIDVVDGGEVRIEARS